MADRVQRDAHGDGLARHERDDAVVALAVGEIELPTRDEQRGAARQQLAEAHADERERAVANERQVGLRVPEQLERQLERRASRRGDEAAAHDYARRAHDLAALPWAGQAMLERHAMGDDWAGALSVVEANLARKTIDRATADRQRAVLKTAIALDLKERDANEALALAREAIKLAPGLVPANALAGALLATGYNAVLGIWPFVVMNGAIAVIDVAWLVRLQRGRHDPAAYPAFDEFYTALDTKLSKQAVRELVRIHVRRRVEESIGRELVGDIVDDVQIQTALRELLATMKIDPKTIPDLAFLADVPPPPVKRLGAR